MALVRHLATPGLLTRWLARFAPVVLSDAKPPDLLSDPSGPTS